MTKIYRVQMNSRGAPDFSTAVEVADRPQGEWFMGNRPLEGKFRIFRCSVCGYEPFYKGEPITPTNMTLRYCPNCGCRMKGA